MRICFDLDGTLCDGETQVAGEPTDYSTCKPKVGVVNMLRNSRAQGWTVIIQTARGMGSSNGNVGVAQAAIAQLTLNQLAEWGFEYDEIYFGKPSADYYVDDKGINAKDFFKPDLAGAVGVPDGSQ